MPSVREFGRRVARLIAAGGLAAAATVAAAPSSHAAASNYAAFVLDANTGEALFSRNADARRYPASLTKMMTLYLVFEDLASGKISLNTRLRVSETAAAQPPSKLGVRAGSTIEVEDAILALVTRSANDVAVVVAENLGGSVDGFARRMTSTAHRIGMRNSTFRNPHGLPNSAQTTTARDMATLGLALQDRFPAYYRYFSTRVFVWNGTRIGNHNRLLGRYEGVDGIKTGYTRASGFNLVTSVRRDGRHVVAVVMGGNSARSRDDHMVELLRAHVPRASRGARTAPQLVAEAPPLPREMPPVPRAKPAFEIVTAAIAPSQVPSAPVVQQVATAEPLALVAPAADLEGPTAQGDIDDAASAATAAATGGIPAGWKIQLGALPSQSAADMVLDRASSAAPQILASLSPYTETVSRGSATLYRARFAGFANKEAARAACVQLVRKDFTCLAVPD